MPVYELGGELWFPPPSEYEEHGIVAIGGDLNPERLLLAYRNGIFPWYNSDDPILWWCPEDRMVLRPQDFRIAHSLRNIINRQVFEIRVDQNFKAVIHACKTIPRKGQNGTWITNEMEEAYLELHKMDIAHSIECYQDGKLAGGLYGLSLGRIFCGESMFSKVSNASKIAFAFLCQQIAPGNIDLIDCQVANPFLEQLGAYEISREHFLKLVHANKNCETPMNTWKSKNI